MIKLDPIEIKECDDESEHMIEKLAQIVKETSRFNLSTHLVKVNEFFPSQSIISIEGNLQMIPRMSHSVI